ncbi:hypothetical protein [Sodalinema gerasimenkoae]|uniref:hypothetical protein n=1 Tax=Sodalinema gerasimenkoae TaxID=2862348 RepID=UPI00135C7D63|nr:hypothetical protein [Sodalinema gerasimenkoae]
MSTTAVTQVITTLKAAHDNLGLERSPDDDFFGEWRQDFPPLSDAENETLDLIRQRFRYHRDMGQVSEGGVNAIVVSRLLELAGFYDPFVFSAITRESPAASASIFEGYLGLRDVGFKGNQFAKFRQRY